MTRNQTEQNNPNILNQEKKYKFGVNDLDLNTYIYNISNNVQSYLDHKIKYEHWNDAQVKEFSNSYREYLKGLEEQRDSGVNRFSTDSLGSIIDNTGQLSDVDTDNTYYNDKGEAISEENYNSLKSRKLKKYKTFEANREVATFLNKVGKGTKKLIEQKKPLEKFDLFKHGFINYWQNANNPSGGPMELKPYLDMDLYDATTGKRNVDKRATYLADEISKYVDQLLNYDYTDSPFKTSDSYKNLLVNLVELLRNKKWDNNDLIALNKAGISGKFYNTFFSTDENPNLTPEEKQKIILEKEELVKKQKEQDLLKSKQDLIKEQLEIFKNNNYTYSNDNPYNIGALTTSKYYDKEGNFDRAKFGDSFPVDTNLTLYMNTYLANPWNNPEALKAWSGLIGYNIAQPVQGSEELSGYYYVPQTSDSLKNSVLVYNPTTGNSFHTFIGNIPSLWKKFVDKWKVDLGLTNEYDKYMFKEGGTISSYLLGGGVNLNALFEQDRQNRLQQTAAANTNNTSYHSGRDSELLEAGNRKVLADPTLENPNNGFSGTDLLRLGTIAADIVSMGSAFVPVYGTAVSAATGISSSIGTFFADAFEDGLDSGDFKNLGANLGLDVLGLIPGGGSASKGVKIAKNLGKYASRIIAAVGASHTIANGDKIINSYSKLLDSPSELSVDDWRNISAGLGLITGGTAAATRKYLKVKQEAALGSKVKDNVAVDMINANGEKKTVLFAGDEAKAIREAHKSGDINKLLDMTINKYERFKGWTLPTQEKFTLQSPISKGKLQSVFTKKPTTNNVHDVKMDSKGIYIDRGKFKADEYLPLSEKLALNSIGGGKKALLQSEVDANIENYNKNLEAELKRTAAVSDKFKLGIPTLRERVLKAQAKKEEFEKSLNVISSKKTLLETEINTLQLLINTKKHLKGKSKKANLKEHIKIKNTETELTKKLKLLKEVEESAEAKSLRHNIALKDKRIKEAENIIAGINNKTFHSARYNELVKNGGENFTFLPSKFRDPITNSVKEMLQKYNIVYKNGGSLDVNKVKKYLNGSTITTIANPLPIKPQVKLPSIDNLKQYLPKASSLMELKRFNDRQKGNELLIDIAKKANIPYYQSLLNLPKLNNTGYINAIIDAKKSAGALNSAASQNAVTSDIDKQKAYSLEALAKGESLKMLGNALDREAMNKNKELNYLSSIEEYKTNHNIAQQNKLSGLQTISNNYKLDESQIAQSMLNIDNLNSAYEQDLRMKENKLELLNEKYILNDILKDVLNNLKNYTDLTEDELNAWNLYTSGLKTPSELLSDIKLGSAYKSAYRKASEAELLQQKKFFNIPENAWSIPKEKSIPEWNGNFVSFNKKGASISIAKIKAHLLDMKNFLKVVSESNLRNSKDLDRISKSLYNFVKTIIVK